VHVPGAAARIHHVAAGIAAERAAAHGMAARDQDALLPDQLEGQGAVDLPRRVQDQGLVRAEEDAAGPRRAHGAGAPPHRSRPVRSESSQAAWSSSASAYSNPRGVTRPTGRSRNMTARVMVWL